LIRCCGNNSGMIGAAKCRMVDHGWVKLYFAEDLLGGANDSFLVNLRITDEDNLESDTVVVKSSRRELVEYSTLKCEIFSKFNSNQLLALHRSNF